MGLIGTGFVSYLNQLGYQDIVVVDDFSRLDKVPNLEGKKLTARVQRREAVYVIDAQRRNAGNRPTAKADGTNP